LQRTKDALQRAVATAPPAAAAAGSIRDATLSGETGAGCGSGVLADGSHSDAETTEADAVGTVDARRAKARQRAAERAAVLRDKVKPVSAQPVDDGKQAKPKVWSASLGGGGAAAGARVLGGDFG
jgi:hypothetical protein